MTILIKWTWIISIVSLLCGCVNTPIDGFQDYNIFQGNTCGD